MIIGARADMLHRCAAPRSTTSTRNSTTSKTSECDEAHTAWRHANRHPRPVRFRRDGRPVYIEQLGKLDLKKLYEVTTPERQLQKLVVEYEKFQRERLPVCTAQKGELVETSCTIMDLKNVGLSQFWKVSGYVQEASKIGQYYYPETMGKVSLRGERSR